MKDKSDFSQGKVWKNILDQAIPLTLAELVHLLYNVVDRIYIGHMPGVGSMALTGIGLAFPITTLVAAFTKMFSQGGSPIFAIARGARKEERAEKILGQVFAALSFCAILLTVFGYIYRRPILFLFGASEDSYVYADEYLKIYLFGTLPSMLATGLNNFINAQGYPRIGMLTVVLGAALNLVLDPIFIYSLGMGVRGAALATVISQCASAVWVMAFFYGKKSLYRIRLRNMMPDLSIYKDMFGLGITGFIMQGTNCLTQILCNVTLRAWGGDIYVGVMTVLNSVREILSLPSQSITTGAQPVLSYNYGAGKFKRLREGIRFSALCATLYMVFAWLVVILFPGFFMGIFTDDPEMIATGIPALKIYFFGFVLMAGQSAGQTTFTALKCPKRAIFFSLLRKVVIVAPLTLLLPQWGMGVDGVFAAEPISNVIGGIACFTTMWFTLYRKLPDRDYTEEEMMMVV